MFNGEPVFRHQTGFADLEAGKPMTGRERVNLYSCSKIATCVAALQLFEKGLFKLDDPLADYMPEYADMKVREADGCEAFMLLQDVQTKAKGQARPRTALTCIEKWQSRSAFEANRASDDMKDFDAKAARLRYGAEFYVASELAGPSESSK